jgi:hypothetical protein
MDKTHSFSCSSLFVKVEKAGLGTPSETIRQAGRRDKGLHTQTAGCLLQRLLHARGQILPNVFTAGARLLLGWVASYKGQGSRIEAHPLLFDVCKFPTRLFLRGFRGYLHADCSPAFAS